MRMRASITTLSLLVGLTSLAGCDLLIEQELWVNADGSGRIRFTVTSPEVLGDGEGLRRRIEAVRETWTGLVAITPPRASVDDGKQRVAFTAYFEDLNEVRSMPLGETWFSQEFVFERTPDGARIQTIRRLPWLPEDPGWRHAEGDGEWLRFIDHVPGRIRRVRAEVFRRFNLPKARSHSVEQAFRLGDLLPPPGCVLDHYPARLEVWCGVPARDEKAEREFRLELERARAEWDLYRADPGRWARYEPANMRLREALAARIEECLDQLGSALPEETSRSVAVVLRSETRPPEDGDPLDLAMPTAKAWRETVTEHVVGHSAWRPVGSEDSPVGRPRLTLRLVGQSDKPRREGIARCPASVAYRIEARLEGSDPSDRPLTVTSRTYVDRRLTGSQANFRDFLEILEDASKSTR